MGKSFADIVKEKGFRYAERIGYPTVARQNDTYTKPLDAPQSQNSENPTGLGFSILNSGVKEIPGVGAALGAAQTLGHLTASLLPQNPIDPYANVRPGETIITKYAEPGQSKEDLEAQELERGFRESEQTHLQTAFENLSKPVQAAPTPSPIQEPVQQSPSPIARPVPQEDSSQPSQAPARQIQNVGIKIKPRKQKTRVGKQRKIK
jgi:hypothetical protein